jgi:hypothetical protein
MLGAPPRAVARVVVVRPEKGFFGVDGAFPVELDGEPLGELKTGTFAYPDRPADVINFRPRSGVGLE